MYHIYLVLNLKKVNFIGNISIMQQTQVPNYRQQSASDETLTPPPSYEELFPVLHHRNVQDISNKPYNCHYLKSASAILRIIIMVWLYVLKLNYFFRFKLILLLFYSFYYLQM